MRITLLILFMISPAFAQTEPSGCASDAGIQMTDASSVQGDKIKITIATGGEPYGPAKNTFRRGERVPLVITMTNTGSEPVYVCGSDTIYQDRPQLIKDGKVIPYMPFRQSGMLAAERDKTCDELNLPEQILLRPNEPTVVDWFVLVKGATSLYDNGWYDPLPAGKYTLSNRRRLSSCDGPLSPTNTISFVVVP